MLMSLLKGIIDDKILKIIQLFMTHPNELYHINKVAEETVIPVSTTFRIMKKLVKLGIIQYRTISKFKVYHLANNDKTKKLKKIIG